MPVNIAYTHNEHAFEKALEKWSRERYRRGAKLVATAS